MPKPLTSPTLARRARARPAAASVSCRTRLDQPQIAARRAGLAHRQLPAAGVGGHRAVAVERVGAHELRRPRLRRTGRGPRTASSRSPGSRRRTARSPGPWAGCRPCAYSSSRSTDQPPRTMIGSSRKALWRSVAASTVHEGQAQVARAGLAHHQHAVAAGAGHDAVEQVDRVGDDARGHVLVQRQRLLEHRVRDASAFCALRHADLAEVLAPGAAACACSVR